MKRLLLALLLAVPLAVGSTIGLTQQRAEAAEPIKVMAFADSAAYFPVRFAADVEKAGGKLVMVLEKGTKPRAAFYQGDKKLGEIPLQGDDKFAENQKAVLDWLAKADKPDAPPDKKPDKTKWGRGYKPLSPEKRAAIHADRAAMHNGRMRALVAASTPPAEFDCKDMGWCGDTGDQADCGSCYLYSTVKTATSAFVKSGAGKVDVFRLSFQYGMDCHDFGGCNGGNGTEVIDWMVKNGWPAESYVDATGKTVSDYPPYTASSQQCRLPANAKKWAPKDWLFITGDQGDHPATVAEYKAAIMAFGRVNIAIDAGGQFSNYQSGIITSMGNNIDHEVNVRGWSDAKQALLVENQWAGWGGAKSGGDNCAWVSYNAVGALQDPFVTSASVLPPIPPQPPIPPNPPNPPNPPGPGPYATVTIAAPGDYWLVPVPLTDADRMQLIRAMLQQGGKKP